MLSPWLYKMEFDVIWSAGMLDQCKSWLRAIATLSRLRSTCSFFHRLLILQLFVSLFVALGCSLLLSYVLVWLFRLYAYVVMFGAFFKLVYFVGVFILQLKLYLNFWFSECSAAVSINTGFGSFDERDAGFLTFGRALKVLFKPLMQ